jgi:uncharacterized protein YabE (DUF348 family)/3D (Asp-Asp-Asp) domain-containing protein
MNRTKWMIVIGVPLVLAVVFGVFMLTSYKEVTVVKAGHEVTVKGIFWRAEGAIKRSGFSYDAGDGFTPALNARVHSGDVVTIDSGIVYEITFDGSTYSTKTTLTNLMAVLITAGVTPAPGQSFYVDGERVTMEANLEAAAHHYIEVYSPRSVSVVDNGVTQEVVTAGQRVMDVLDDAGIVLLNGDEVFSGMVQPIQDGVTITIERAKKVRIEVDGTTIESRVVAGTVGEALASAGVALQGLDYSIPDASSALNLDETIQVVRVTEEVIIEQAVIPYSAEEQLLYDQPLDTYQVVQAGQPGIEANRVRIRYENGEEVARTEEDTWVAQEPVNQISGYGYQPTVRTMDTPYGPIEYYRSMEFYITAYNVDKTSVGMPWHGYVYCDNQKFQPGFVGADLDFLPCGTQLYIEGFGFATVMDTDNGAVTGAWIDIGYFDEDFTAWHQNGMVYFLTPIPSYYPAYIPEGSYNP